MNDLDRQSDALIGVLKDSLKITREHLKTVCILLVISILANIAIVGMFLYYESQFETTEATTRTTVTQEVDGNSSINNIEGNQYNDNAVHNE